MVSPIEGAFWPEAADDEGDACGDADDDDGDADDHDPTDVNVPVRTAAQVTAYGVVWRIILAWTLKIFLKKKTTSVL